MALLAQLIALTVSAQATQKGIVKEYHGKEAKTVLETVEINIRSAQSTISATDGTFQLNFLSLKPGDRISVREIKKHGYEIFNKDAIDQWNINPDATFEIVLCRSDKFKQLCDKYYRNASANYKIQYDREVALINKLKAENKIKQKEFQQRMSEIQNIYDRQLDNLDVYVDRFARIDLSELSSAEQEIIELVQEGKFDEAIARYDDLKLVDKYLDGLKQNTKLRESIAQLQQALSQLDQESLQAAGIMCSIGDSYAAANEFSSALVYYNRALRIKRSILGLENPDIVSLRKTIDSLKLKVR